MRAIILAAGQGVRLAGEPKALLPFRTWTLLDLQLACLEACGIEKTTVMVRPMAGDIAARVGRRAQIVTAPQGGSAGSLARGLITAWGEPVIVLDCDVLFHPDLLQCLIDNPAKCAAVIDENDSTGRQAYVCDGHIVAVGNSKGAGRFMGMMKLSPGKAEITAHVLVKKRETEYWEAFPWSQVEAGVVLSGRYPVVDIDTQQDSLRAHRDVFPQVLAGLGLMGAEAL